MNHRTVLERADHSGFHMVTSNKRTGAHPVGYCADHAPHATEDEARRCFRSWERDHVRLDQHFANWGDCAADGCGSPTKMGARIEGDGYSGARLCSEHFTTAHAVSALRLDGDLAGDSWQS